MTVKQLAKHTGIRERLIYTIVKELHHSKQLYISERYRPQSGRGGTAAVWAAGRQPDAPIITQAQACKRWRERTKLKHQMAKINSPFAQLIAHSTRR